MLQNLSSNWKFLSCPPIAPLETKLFNQKWSPSNSLSTLNITISSRIPVFYTRAWLFLLDEGSCYMVSTRNNSCEFCVFDDIYLHCFHKSLQWNVTRPAFSFKIEDTFVTSCISITNYRRWKYFFIKMISKDTFTMKCHKTYLSIGKF